MTKIRFYVVRHIPNGVTVDEYSVQDDPLGGGLMLDMPFNMNKEQAEMAAMAANSALQIVGMLKGEE